MAKILDASQLAECAEARGIDISDFVESASAVAEQLAASIGADLIDCSNQIGFGGLCASFRAPADVECPDDTDEADRSGDFHD